MRLPITIVYRTSFLWRSYNIVSFMLNYKYRTRFLWRSYNIASFMLNYRYRTSFF